MRAVSATAINMKSAELVKAICVLADLDDRKQLVDLELLDRIDGSSHDRKGPCSTSLIRDPRRYGTRSSAFCQALRPRASR